MPYTPLLASAGCGLFNLRIAEEPIRRKSRGLRYIKASVKGIDFNSHTLLCEPAFDHFRGDPFGFTYDKVIIAPGCTTNTFGTPGVESHALFVKTVSDAMAIRQKLSDMFEMASLPSTSENRQRELLQLVIVGGGPTGIEITAGLTDLFHNDLAMLYPYFRDKMPVAVHDVAPQILVPLTKAFRNTQELLYEIIEYRSRPTPTSPTLRQDISRPKRMERLLMGC